MKNDRKSVSVKLTSFKKPATICRQHDAKLLGSDARSRKERPHICVRSGTVAALCRSYQNSPKYDRLAAESQRQKDYYLAIICERFGALSPRALTARMILDAQAAFAGSAGKANGFVSAVSALMKFAISHDEASMNPAANIERLRLGEFKPWPKDLLERVIEVASPQDKLAIYTGIFSGQRISDCIRISHQMMEGGIVDLVQKKTRKRVFIPVHPKWAEAVSVVPKKASTIIYDHYGRPFRITDTLRARVRIVLEKVGGEAYTFHGLRKNATNYLAELGLSHHEIATVTGMDIKTLVHYTKDIDNRRVAESIAARVREGNPFL